MAGVACLLTIGLSAGCGRPVDLTTGLEVRRVSSGWLDTGMVGGQRKLVPTLTVTLSNASDETLALLKVNALFGRVGDEDEWGSSYLAVAGAEGLAAGAATVVTTTSQLGYTGSESGLEMLANTEFVDARVDLFAKYGPNQWTRLGRYKVDRALLAQ